jgi:asparagine synthase (glutamine-hydrolysing)
MPPEIERVAGARVRDRWSDVQSRLADAEANLFRGASSTLEGDVARLETQGYLSAQLLRDTDVMSMAHGLEVRVPFVDHRLAGAIWPALGHYPALLEGKRLLHESLPKLPDVVRQPKRGFTLPFDTWMRGGLRETTLRGIESSVALGWINARAAAAVWGDFERGRAHWSRAWGLSVLGQFLQEAA